MSREIYVPLGEVANANLYFRRRNAAGLYWRCDTSVYEAYNASNLAKYGADAGSGTPYNVLTEDGATGDYFGDDPTTGPGTWTAYEQAGAEPAEGDQPIADGVIGVNVTHVAGTAQTAGDLAALLAPLYWATVRNVVNDTTGQDEWTIVPMKDGVAQTSATSVTLTVTKRSDGTALINAQAATQIGATSVWKYTALTSERIYDGTDSYVAVVTFTCDAGSRTAPPVIVARDG